MVLGALAGAAGLSSCTCSSSEVTFESSAAACERRASWPHPLSAECTRCLGLAPAPPGCEESNRSYSARCADKQRAKLDAKTCEPVFRCSYKCRSSDCACVANCFEGHPECDKIIAALESCVVSVCEPFCK